MLHWPVLEPVSVQCGNQSIHSVEWCQQFYVDFFKLCRIFWIFLTFQKCFRKHLTSKEYFLRKRLDWSHNKAKYMFFKKSVIFKFLMTYCSFQCYLANYENLWLKLKISWVNLQLLSHAVCKLKMSIHFLFWPITQKHSYIWRDFLL